MGGLAAQGFKGIDGREIGLGGQLTGEQEQQLTQLQREAATEERGFMTRQAIKGQEQLLLQHPFPAVFSAELADHGRNGATALGGADQGVVGVIPAHHHLLLAHQQVGQGVFQLGVDHLHGACHPAHHIPVGFGQRPAVHLLQQLLEPDGLDGIGAVELGFNPQAPHQLFQQFALLVQRGAPPEAIG